jgi:WD40 repeat protein
VAARHALYSAAIDASGRWLATGAYDSEIRVWDLEQRRLLTPLRGHTNTVFSVELDASGERAITASHDGTAGVWNTRDGASLALLDGRRGLNPAVFALNHAVFSPDGERVATARSNGEIDLWQLASGERQVLAGHTEPAWRACPSLECAPAEPAADGNRGPVRAAMKRRRATHPGSVEVHRGSSRVIESIDEQRDSRAARES